MMIFTNQNKRAQISRCLNSTPEPLREEQFQRPPAAAYCNHPWPCLVIHSGPVSPQKIKISFLFLFKFLNSELCHTGIQIYILKRKQASIDLKTLGKSNSENAPLGFLCRVQGGEERGRGIKGAWRGCLRSKQRSRPVGYGRPAHLLSICMCLCMCWGTERNWALVYT